MNIRHSRHVLIAGLLTCGISVVAPRTARAQGTTLTAEEGGPITIVGCLQMEQMKDKQKYILAKPVQGRDVTVPQATCSVTDTSDAVVLKDVYEHHLDRWSTGTFVMITGRLEGTEHNPKEPIERRELHVKSYRAPEVKVPIAAFALPPDPGTIAANVEPLVLENVEIAEVTVPVATAGIRPALPTTSTALPLVGLIGLLALGGGLTLRLFKNSLAS